ncbi:glycosyltransferase [Acinetobacter indicus]|uniref:glycosyltransferase n=1 Tax=Acinetobacter indicus TaxID=756892 RepID=UPI000CECB6E2|nr:glycosyltransferase [Acinetobacter indicus]
MNIMLFITGLGMGGAEKVVCELADRLYEKGYQVSLVYFTGRIIRRPENEIPIYHIPIKLNFSLLYNLKNILNLVKRVGPSVIHAHMFHANMIARFVKKFNPNIRVICSSHSNYEGGLVRMKLYSMTENLCDIHTNVSQNAANALKRAGAVKNKEIITVYNGIDTDKYSNIPGIKEKKKAELGYENTDELIISIGRIDTPKDYPTLLNAFKLLKDNNKNLRLLIVGDGPKKGEMLNLVRSLELENEVNFLGIRHDIVELLNASDIFVSSSAWEGFGLAILEAMLCEKPIVATRTDGAIELLSNDCLVDCGDKVRLAEQIVNKIKYGSKTYYYDNAKKFDWANIVQQWEKIYKGEVL